MTTRNPARSRQIYNSHQRPSLRGQARAGSRIDGIRSRREHFRMRSRQNATVLFCKPRNDPDHDVYPQSNDWQDQRPCSTRCHFRRDSKNELQSQVGLGLKFAHVLRIGKGGGCKQHSMLCAQRPSLLGLPGPSPSQHKPIIRLTHRSAPSRSISKPR